MASSADYHPVTIDTLRAARRAMQDATDYASWYAAASRHDELTGADLWRAKPACSSYDNDLIHSRVRLLRRLRKADA